MSKIESSVINCQHKISGEERITEWDNNQNHLLNCGCIASPGKLDHDKKEVATWIIDDKDCENNSD